MKARIKPFSFIYYGQMPSGKNAVMVTRSGHRYPSKRFAQWKDDAMHQIGPCGVPFTGPCAIDIDYYPGDKIRRDAPGIQDALFHVLEKLNVVLDDAQFKHVRYSELGVDKKLPRCVVSIWPWKEAGSN